MELVEVTQLDEALTAQLLAVWESAVTATHQFLTAAEMAAIKKYVPTALHQVAYLVVGMDETRQPLAFMGVADKKTGNAFCPCRGTRSRHRKAALGIWDGSVCRTGSDCQ